MVKKAYWKSNNLNVIHITKEKGKSGSHFHGMKSHVFGLKIDLMLLC